jgi:CelD/BcsL family acetyltransferase involved in cellulose biosynthesis
MATIYVRELTGRDARAVARLGRRVYPPGFRESRRNLKQDLEAAEAAESNLSIGLFDGKRLAGFVLAYVLTPADLKELPGSEKITDAEFIYLNDLVIEPRHKRLTGEMLDRFCLACRRYFPGHPMIAHALRSRMINWIKRHQAIVESLGYRLVEIQDDADPALRSDLFLARWRPLPEAERLALVKKGSRGINRVRSYQVGGRTLTVELIKREAGWLALEPVWDALRKKTPGHTIFQSFAYLRSWWLHFGLSNQLFILSIRWLDEIIGIAPLQLVPVKILGRYYRQLSCIGSRWQVDRPALLLSDQPRECGLALQLFLADHQNEWDFCEFHEQLPDNDLLKLLRNGLAPDAYLFGLTEDSFCPYLELAGTWQDLLATRSAKFRKNLKTARRKLESCGRLGYQSFHGGDLARRFEQYAALEERSWKAVRKVGCSRNAQYFSFYRGLASTFGPRDAFHIRFLTVNDQPIAGTFGLLEGDHYYSLQIVHDPAFGRYSPGTLLEALEMEECFARGYREYDFLGGFLNNKRRWTSQGRRTVQVHGFKKTPRLRLFFWLHFMVKPAVKQRLRRWGLTERLSRVFQLRGTWSWRRRPQKDRPALSGEGSRVS